MATLFGVIAIGVFILLMVAAGRNKLAARTQDALMAAAATTPATRAQSARGMMSSSTRRHSQPSYTAASRQLPQRGILYVLCDVEPACGTYGLAIPGGIVHHLSVSMSMARSCVELN